ncbi:MAG TPA: DUF4157 domain-containing protein, partial [Ktedonobacteraceae bacterium]
MMRNSNSPQFQRRKPSVSSLSAPARVTHPSSLPAPANGQNRIGHSLDRLPIFPAASNHESPSEQSSFSLKDRLQQAMIEGSSSLDTTVSNALGEKLSHNFNRVRIHSGPTSAQVAKQLGARAFTVGNDIFLGATAHRLQGGEREQLLTHEAVHTAQQGSSMAIPWGRLAVSTPADAAEVEARHIATSLTQTPAQPTSSRSLALRDQVRATPPTRQAVSRVTTPLIQRDIDRTQNVAGNGNLSIKFKPYKQAATHTDPEETGMKGNIIFKPSKASDPANSIKFVQTVRLKDLTTNNEYQWTGGEAPRMAVMTATDATTNVAGGHFIDTTHAALAVRNNPTDPVASPYYTDFAPGAPRSGYAGQEGYHKTKFNKKTRNTTHQIKQVKLHDEPACEHRADFSFE